MKIIFYEIKSKLSCIADYNLLNIHELVQENLYQHFATSTTNNQISAMIIGA